jgi:hypothetical protein
MFTPREWAAFGLNSPDCSPARESSRLEVLKIYQDVVCTSTPLCQFNPLDGSTDRELDHGQTNEGGDPGRDRK